MRHLILFSALLSLAVALGAPQDAAEKLKSQIRTEHHERNRRLLSNLGPIQLAYFTATPDIKGDAIANSIELKLRQSNIQFKTVSFFRQDQSTPTLEIIAISTLLPTSPPTWSYRISARLEESVKLARNAEHVSFATWSSGEDGDPNFSDSDSLAIANQKIDEIGTEFCNDYLAANPRVK